MSSPPPKPAKPTTASSSSGSSEDAPAVTSAEGEAVTSETVFQFSETASKNVADILALDSEDESLRRYKESLLGSAAHGDLGDTSDARRLVVTEFAVVFEPSEGRPDIVHHLDTEEGCALLKSEGIQMKEGAKFKFRISFRVQHEIIAGIKFINKVSATMMSEEDSLMIGSYPPSSVPFTFEFPKFDYNEAPKGMLYRGKYRVQNTFMDSDRVKHLMFDYELTIKKSW